jgi:hypothetical protein
MIFIFFHWDSFHDYNNFYFKNNAFNKNKFSLKKKKNKKYMNKEIEFLLKIKINIFFPLWFKLLESNKYLNIVIGFYFINHVTHENW